jgi:hypothetical protein
MEIATQRDVMSRSVLGLACAAALLGVACGGGNVEVTRLLTPKDAMNGQGKLTPLAVVRPGGERIDVPPTAKIEADRVVTSGEHVHKLGPEDVIQTDDQGRIVAVRTPSGTTQFVPGTAVSPEGADFVRGMRPESQSSIPITKKDRIEMRGSFAPDETIPGGGRVETTRSTSLLVGGTIVLALAYLPMAYVGIRSSNSADRALLLPVAGPWIDWAIRPSCQAPPGAEALPIDPCLEETASRVGLVLGGAFQTLGGLMIAFGLPARSTVVYEDTGVASASRGPRVTIVPSRGGAALVGTF